MKQVSIIIDGVRYDSTPADDIVGCDDCDLKHLCHSAHLPGVCAELIGYGSNFKESTKSFEP